MKNISWYNTNECSSRGIKYSIGEKQVKVFMMKKFLIVIFSIFGLMVGMLALMAIEYQISYNKWKSSYTGKIVTNSEEKYSTSSDGNKDDFESSKQEYATSSSSTKNYDYKKYSSPIDEYNDNFELLFNLLVEKLFSPTLVEKEFKRAYETAKNLSADSPISMQAIKNKIKIYNYSEGANQYAVYKLNIDWTEQALLKAKSLQKYRYSKEKLVEQLINVELFTQEEADYAVEHVNFDWKEDAVKEAESYANGGKITKEKMLEVLVENKKFTQEEAEYAIEHAKIDWSN